MPKPCAACDRWRAASIDKGAPTGETGGMTARRLLRPALAALVLVAGGGYPEEAGDFELREGGIHVRVSGLQPEAWSNLQGLLRDQLSLGSGAGGVRAPLADDLAFFTRQHLLREGWPEAAVRWELAQGSVLLQVEAGERTRVGEVTWRGELPLPPEELRRFLLRPGLERGEGDPPYWVEADLRRGAELVERRLRAEGHLQADVKLEPAPAATGGRRELVVHVQPGPVFRFGRVSLRGAPDELRDLMRAEIEQATGEPFNEARVQSLEQRVNHVAIRRGWLQSVTSAEYTLAASGGTVDVLLKNRAGPRARIAEVQPDRGFSRGARRVLSAGFQEAVGDWYSEPDTDFLFRRALDTGMFTRLDVEPVVRPQPADGALADLIITGEQAQPHTLGFEVGYDTFLGPQSGVNYRNTNLRDTGLTLAAELNWSLAGPLGFLRLTDPAIFNTPYAASAHLAMENFDLYEYSRYGSSLNFEVSRRLSSFFSYSGFFGVSVNTVSTDVLEPEEIGPDLYTLATLGGSLMLDFRDSPVLPRRGWFLSGRLETTLDVMGSNVSFIRTDLRGAWHHPLTRHLRFTAGGSLMNLQGAAAQDLPIDSRVFNGGPNSVRAFAERELGPLTPGGTPLGGTSALLGTVELSYEFYPNFEFALFGDVGSLGRDKNTTAFDISTDFRPAAGAGLRYKLPFGPVRVDYGHNLDRRSGEGSGMLHVTVGFSF